MGSAAEVSPPNGQASSLSSLIPKVQAFVEDYMSRYDASHNYEHIERVLGIARSLEASERQLHPESTLDHNIITLACMLHDVGDSKYLEPGEDGTVLVEVALTRLGATSEMAKYLQTIVNNVSFTKEMGDPSKVQAVLPLHPELAIVQDADRLDALGAHGIGRIFTFNTAKGATSMQVAYEHIDYKLLDREKFMKTAAGKEMAKERCEQLRLFQKWWTDEETLRLRHAKRPLNVNV